MGLLSDFFVANEGEAARYADRMSEDDQGKAIALQLRPAEYKGFTDLEVGTLWAILEGKEWDADLHALESDEGGDEGDSWLFRFPDRLVQLLTHVEHSALDAALPDGPTPRSFKWMWRNCDLWCWIFKDSLNRRLLNRSRCIYGVAYERLSDHLTDDDFAGY